MICTCMYAYIIKTLDFNDCNFTIHEKKTIIVFIDFNLTVIAKILGGGPYNSCVGYMYFFKVCI